MTDGVERTQLDTFWCSLNGTLTPTLTPTPSLVQAKARLERGLAGRCEQLENMWGPPQKS